MNDKKTDPDTLWYLLGEIRGDLKYLVAERQHSMRRINELEENTNEQHASHAKRLSALEAFRIKIGVLATTLGVLVPTAVTITAKKMGLL